MVGKDCAQQWPSCVPSHGDIWGGGGKIDRERSCLLGLEIMERGHDVFPGEHLFAVDGNDAGAFDVACGGSETAECFDCT